MIPLEQSALFALIDQYEELCKEHLKNGGNSTLEDLLAFQRVLQFYTDGQFLGTPEDDH